MANTTDALRLDWLEHALNRNDSLYTPKQNGGEFRMIGGGAGRDVDVYSVRGSTLRDLIDSAMDAVRQQSK